SGSTIIRYTVLAVHSAAIPTSRAYRSSGCSKTLTQIFLFDRERGIIVHRFPLREKSSASARAAAGIAGGDQPTAVGFTGLLNFVMGQLPQNEVRQILARAAIPPSFPGITYPESLYARCSGVERVDVGAQILSVRTDILISAFTAQVVISSSVIDECDRVHVYRKIVT